MIKIRTFVKAERVDGFHPKAWHLGFSYLYLPNFRVQQIGAVYSLAWPRRYLGSTFFEALHGGFLVSSKLQCNLFRFRVLSCSSCFGPNLHALNKKGYKSSTYPNPWTIDIFFWVFFWFQHGLGPGFWFHRLNLLRLDYGLWLNTTPLQHQGASSMRVMWTKRTPCF